MRWLLLLNLLLSGCGTAGYYTFGWAPTDPFFAPYIKEIETLFLQEIGRPIKVKTSIIFSFDKNMKEAGRCSFPNPLYSGLIELNYTLFEKIVPAHQHDWLIPLMLHEIGHCDLGRDHSQELVGLESRKQELYPEYNYIPGVNKNSNKHAIAYPSVIKSLMWPVNTYEDYYSMNPVYYIRELFDETLYPEVPAVTTVYTVPVKSLPDPENVKFYRVLDKEDKTIIITVDYMEFMTEMNK